MRLTYNEYDRIEDICHQISVENEEKNIGTSEYFQTLHNWPTVEQMEAIDIKNHIDEYFPYLMFWYTQKLDDKLVSNADEYAEYRNAMQYIRNLMESSIEFIDE